MRMVPVVVSEPSTTVTVPDATESEGAVPPISASAFWISASACGLLTGAGDCWAERDAGIRIHRSSTSAGRGVRMLPPGEKLSEHDTIKKNIVKLIYTMLVKASRFTGRAVS